MSDLKVGRALWLSQFGAHARHIQQLHYLSCLYFNSTYCRVVRQTKRRRMQCDGFIYSWELAVPCRRCCLRWFSWNIDGFQMQDWAIICAHRAVGAYRLRFHKSRAWLHWQRSYVGNRFSGCQRWPIKVLHKFQTHKGDTLAMRFHRVSSGRNIEVEKEIKFERCEGSAVCVFETFERFGKLLV